MYTQISTETFNSTTETTERELLKVEKINYGEPSKSFSKGTFAYRPNHLLLLKLIPINKVFLTETSVGPCHLMVDINMVQIFRNLIDSGKRRESRKLNLPLGLAQDLEQLLCSFLNSF